MTKKIIITATIFLVFLTLITSCAFLRLKKFKNALKKQALVSQNFPERFKFSLGQFVIIKALLNQTSQEKSFILDTGSPCTYSYKTKDTLRLPSKKLFRFDTYKTDYGFSDARIGNICYKNLQYLIMDYDLFKWQKVSGIVGVNAMQNSIWEINFKDTTITVSDTLIHFTNTKNAFKTHFKPYSSQQTPVIKLLINGKDSVTAFIDTGEPGFIVFNSKFDIAKMQRQNPEDVKTSYGYINQEGAKAKSDSIYERNYIKLNSLKIDNLELNSAIVLRSPTYRGQNLVGLEFLKKFIVTIDWKHYTLYLQPIENPVIARKLFSYGFECYKIGGILKITDLFKGSLAEQSGIKCGDEILKINNQDAKDVDRKVLKSINDDFPSDMEITFGFKDKNITLKKVSIF